MKINSDFKDLLSLLNDESVEYLLVGGYAVILHSEPRYTKDLDIWIRPTKDNAARLYRALKRFGAPLQQLGLREQDFCDEGSFVQLGREPVRIDLLMGVKGLIFQDAWDRRDVVKIEGLAINLISRVDLIDAKLEAGRPQDLMDAKTLRQSIATRSKG